MPIPWPIVIQILKIYNVLKMKMNPFSVTLLSTDILEVDLTDFTH